ncbi:capsule biosynthesis protein [Pseudosulfitobacter pseudonitzschiae]|uniref:capsule biosynthesis protein n=1 Tax=Pseudosulfitobacter pseudonitzschiae TaxID=1402135 RepID=UPI001AF9C970|nr:capsule biosynthesis protein [Pseudosulfitobacter pseudonitzschiae]MBM1815013.1 capsule biosynthesis protein [Pseudosulfitobacter pseudonitzschiae]MBM1832004.1 capsule biosynthesis protein [Pseudosulfitobacter pseudonitzschiae]MBM1836872.1 capsule biosynthesis protein [Pseudosulfitobacter pseudonitzschiae]MBM1841718.1 capsule biosynthesis protein [Pseudosulfitobacter pseudonitzschiae]MBM1846586.1 capsule biosynthesis protein [Pseudosulfitobacter pseudonitzschiae]
MTTKPKARKFRIKRTTPQLSGTSESATPAASAPLRPVGDTSAAATPRPTVAAPSPTPRPSAPSERPAPAQQSAPPQQPRPQQPQEPQAAARPEQPQPEQPQLRQGEVSSAHEVAGENDMDAIRHEGLTGRQLRMARRVAQKHGLAPTSDFDAVRLLRAEGIDPFQRSNMLDLVVPSDGGRQPGEPDGFENLPARTDQNRHQLPQTVPAGRMNLPSTELSPAEKRVKEISQIQRDIGKRRRKKLGLLLVRLAFFVALPTFLAGWYFYQIATPMYATKADFLIIQNEGSGGAGPLGGLLPTQFATNSDAIATQGYLQSKDAMLRLDDDLGFKAHFTQDWIDPIQRLNTDPTNEEAYKVYKKNVKIGYDPTEGMIRLEVVAAEPEVSAEFARRLISYAEQRVNNLSQQKREDQMKDAREGFEKAEAERRAAQEALVKLQVESSTLDPQAVIAALRTQITNYETLLLEKELELAALEDNARPNQARLDGVKGDIRRLQDQLAKLNQRMNEASEGENSLAQMAVNLQLAQADLASRDMMLQSALQQMEQSRVEASRQVRYLTVAVQPVASQEPTYPRKFENTVLAFLIFAGIYLMISLTASILREQVTS